MNLPLPRGIRIANFPGNRKDFIEVAEMVRMLDHIADDKDFCNYPAEAILKALANEFRRYK